MKGRERMMVGEGWGWSGGERWVTGEMDVRVAEEERCSDGVSGGREAVGGSHRLRLRSNCALSY